MGLNTLWSISNWELESPYRWTGWALPDCPAEIEEDNKTLITHLAGIAPVSKKLKDKRGWGRRIGSYTMAEGYRMYSENYNVPNNPDIWNRIWKTRTLPKIDMFSWTLMHQRLLTGENLEKKGMAGPFRCPLCAENS